MELQLKEEMFNIFTINAIQQIDFSAILLSMTRPLSTMDLALKTVLSSNTSLLTFNSLESSAIPTELFMNVVLATENVWQIAATVS